MASVVRLSAVFTLLTFIFVACDKPENTRQLPDCIRVKIDEIMREAVRNPPAQVWEWKADGKTYYYITSDCCDQFNLLYDESCNEVCAPDGGFTGAGDGNCPDFQGQIIKTKIWEDLRE